jgi:hypothetical protein
MPARIVEWVGGPHDGQQFAVPTAAATVNFAICADAVITRWACPLHLTADGWRVYWAGRYRITPR